MITVENIADKLNIQPNDLIYKSIKSYLKNQLNSTEIEIYSISKKYGVSDIYDFLAMAKDGKISESIGYDDFFLMDNLTAQRDDLINIINEML